MLTPIQPPSSHCLKIHQCGGSARSSGPGAAGGGGSHGGHAGGLLAGDSGWRATAGLRPREVPERLLAVVEAERGLDDTAMSVLAGIGAGLFMSLRFFWVKGAGRAN